MHTVVRSVTMGLHKSQHVYALKESAMKLAEALIQRKAIQERMQQHLEAIEVAAIDPALEPQ